MSEAPARKRRWTARNLIGLLLATALLLGLLRLTDALTVSFWMELFSWLRPLFGLFGAMLFLVGLVVFVVWRFTEPRKVIPVAIHWAASGVDIALGLSIALVGILALRPGFNEFNIPMGWVSVLFWGLGVWTCFAGVRLFTEQPPERWQAGRNRHLIAVALMAAIVALLWLALLVEAQMYSHDGFGPAMGVVLATIAAAYAAPYLLIVSAVLAIKARRWRPIESHDS